METTITVNQADQIVRQHVLWSVGLGLIPIPLLGIAGVTAIQLDMLKKISNIYDQDFQESNGKAWVSALTGSTAARIAAEAIKTIPGIGSIVGGITSAALSGATTYAIGHVFIKHFETGGSIFDFNPESYKDLYKEKFSEGKEVAKEMKNSDKMKGMKYKLNELNTMLEEGLITKEEFEKLRSEMLGA